MEKKKLKKFFCYENDESWDFSKKGTRPGHFMKSWLKLSVVISNHLTILDHPSVLLEGEQIPLEWWKLGNVYLAGFAKNWHNCDSLTW